MKLRRSLAGYERLLYNRRHPTYDRDDVYWQQKELRMRVGNCYVSHVLYCYHSTAAMPVEDEINAASFLAIGGQINAL